MKLLKRLWGRSAVLTGLLKFFWEQKMWWLIPMVLVMVVLGLLIIFAQSSSVAPFIYVLF